MRVTQSTTVVTGICASVKSPQTLASARAHAAKNQAAAATGRVQGRLRPLAPSRLACIACLLGDYETHGGVGQLSREHSSNRQLHIDNTCVRRSSHPLPFRLTTAANFNVSPPLDLLAQDAVAIPCRSRLQVGGAVWRRIRWLRHRYHLNKPKRVVWGKRVGDRATEGSRSVLSGGPEHTLVAWTDTSIAHARDPRD